MAKLNEDLETLQIARNNIKTALINKGQVVTDDIRTYGNIIENSDLIDTSDANAVANDILLGKTAYVNGNKLVGTYEDSGGGGNAYCYENQTAMSADDMNVDVGTIAITFGNVEQTITSDTLSKASKIKFIQSFTLEEAISESNYISLSTGGFYVSGQITSSSLTLNDYEGKVNITYTSNDGLTYTTNEEIVVDIPEYAYESYGYYYPENIFEAMCTIIVRTFDGPFENKTYADNSRIHLMTFNSVTYNITDNYAQLDFSNAQFLEDIISLEDLCLALSSMPHNTNVPTCMMFYKTTSGDYEIIVDYCTSGIYNGSLFIQYMGPVYNEDKSYYGMGYSIGSSGSNYNTLRKYRVDLTNHTCTLLAEQVWKNGGMSKISTSNVYSHSDFNPSFATFPVYLRMATDGSEVLIGALNTYPNSVIYYCTNGEVSTSKALSNTTYYLDNQYIAMYDKHHYIRTSSQLSNLQPNMLLNGYTGLGANGSVTGDGSIYNSLDKAYILNNMFNLNTSDSNYWSGTLPAINGAYSFISYSSNTNWSNVLYNNRTYIDTHIDYFATNNLNGGLTSFIMNNGMFNNMIVTGLDSNIVVNDVTYNTYNLRLYDVTNDTYTNSVQLLNTVNTVYGGGIALDLNNQSIYVVTQEKEGYFNHTAHIHRVNTIDWSANEILNFSGTVSSSSGQFFSTLTWDIPNSYLYGGVCTYNNVSKTYPVDDIYRINLVNGDMSSVKHFDSKYWRTQVGSISYSTTERLYCSRLSLVQCMNNTGSFIKNSVYLYDFISDSFISNFTKMNMYMYEFTPFSAMQYDNKIYCIHDAGVQNGNTFMVIDADTGAIINVQNITSPTAYSYGYSLYTYDVHSFMNNYITVGGVYVNTQDYNVYTLPRYCGGYALENITPSTVEFVKYNSQGLDYQKYYYLSIFDDFTTGNFIGIGQYARKSEMDLIKGKGTLLSDIEFTESHHVADYILGKE